MNKKIALIGGTGPEGKGLAKRLAITGNQIFIGSRKQERGKEIAEELTNELNEYPQICIKGGDNREMAELSEIIIIVVPYSAHKNTLMQIENELEGKIVIDAVVPMEFQKGPRSIEVEAGSATEEAAQILENSTVIGAFHNLSAEILMDLKKDVIGDVLIRAVDAGPLRNSKHVENLTVLLIGINGRYKAHSSIIITDIN
jgi:NADPH-dependent F420 reductase